MWLSRLTIDWPTALTGFIAGLVIALLTFFLAAYFSPWSTLTAMREQQAEIQRLDQIVGLLGDSEMQVSEQAKQSANQLAKTQQQLNVYRSADFGEFLAALLSFQVDGDMSDAQEFSSDELDFSFTYPASMGQVKQLESDADEEATSTHYFFTDNPSRFTFAAENTSDELLSALVAAENDADWSRDTADGKTVLVWLNFDTDKQSPVTAIRLPTDVTELPYAFFIGPSFYGKDFSEADLHDFLQIAQWFGVSTEPEPEAGSGETVLEEQAEE